MTDLDREAADEYADGLLTIEFENDRNLARCYQATRAREAHLDALVRCLGACEYCGGSGNQNSSYGERVCSDCDGTGLTEAARKGLENG